MNMETKDLENAINKWFEMKYQTYDKLEHDGSIYLYYEGEKYAEILIEKKPINIFYDLKLYEDFFEIIPIQRSVFQEIMSKWVEDTFNLMGFIPPLKALRSSRAVEDIFNLIGFTPTQKEIKLYSPLKIPLI